MMSLTFILGLREAMGSWKTSPVWRRIALSSGSGRLVSSLPRRVISPEVGRVRSSTVLASVVFPDPLSPRMPRVSDRPISNEA